MGIVNQTIQFHDTADFYNLNGATTVATLYSDATTPTTHPAITLHKVGSNGGQAIAFMYDLARSVVYTRQGNPAWAGQKRDGQIDPIRSDDLFFPDWIDFNKIAIPQADEQQHLLSNIITQGDLHKKPIPRFWFLPKGLKAAIVMTGDNHGDAGMQPRFDINITESTVGCSVDDWNCIRSTGYLYVGNTFNDSLAKYYNNLGFEVALHVNTGCANYTTSEYQNFIGSQFANFDATFPSIPQPTTNRNHCIAWQDWTTTPEIEVQEGIRLDANYYYWPGSWVNNRPGMFTGSGMPMRFARLDGTLIDCYQLVTQMPDESEEVFPGFCDALLDKATGPEGYYGVFTTNMHFDNPDHPDANAVVASAQAHNVPVVTAKQMLTWLDGRNNSSFDSISWNTDTLKFVVNAASGSRNLNAMIPTDAASGHLESILLNNSPITFTVQTIKGIEYAFVPTSGGHYAAIYDVDTTAPVITNVAAAPHTDGTATITWNTNEPTDSKVIFGTVSSSLTSADSSATQVVAHSIILSGLTQGTTYYYRVISKDAGNNTAISPVLLSPPLSFTVPTATCATDKTTSDFSLGTPDANTAIAQNDDGEVILKPSSYNDFSGTTLPSGWQTSIWNSGGAVTVSSGNMVVDGASASTTASFGPGSSLEFKATFSSATFQNVGFAADASFNSPWVTIGEGDTAGTLYAREDGGTSVLLGTGLVGTEHYYRIDWTASAFIIYVDSVQVATISKTVSSNLVAMTSDFNTGGGTLNIDWLRVTPYATSGSYTSRVFDHTDTTKWNMVSWTANVPANTSLAMNVRTGNTPTPDGSWTTYFPVTNGQNIDTISRYIQYRADLATTDQALTPSLNDISITCSTVTHTCTPPLAYISAVNSTVCSGTAIQLHLDSAKGHAPYKLVVNDSTYSNINVGQTFASINPAYASIWGNTGTPSNANGNDGLSIETGIKFRSAVNGFVTGIRFYKGASNTGTHVASLWTKYGKKLATATFTSETPSGWQEVHFATPVYVYADTTYIASYYSPNGYFAITPFFFTSSGVTNYPLTALQSGIDGPNGVYVYGGGFPTGGNDANYWVDVLFEQQSTSPQVLTYKLTSITDNNACIDTGASLSKATVTVNPLPVGTIATTGKVCKDQYVDLVFTSSSGTGPYSITVNDTTYTGVVSGVPFNTRRVAYDPTSIWNNSTIPGTQSVLIDSDAIEVGVKFRSALAGKITGIRFYKGSLNTGVHTGSLWSSTGNLLATATFTSETASGWQEVHFTTPVNISANTTYVASYHTTVGRYAYDSKFFATSSTTHYPLTALQEGTDGSNGVYIYGNGGVFPTQSYNSANYWVDVVFEAGSSNVFTLSQVTDANGCSAITAGNSVTAVEFDSVTASITSKTNVACKGSSTGSATVSAAGGSGSFSYLWSDAGSQTSATANGLKAGTYTVTITDVLGCPAKTSVTVTITEPAQSLGDVMSSTNVLCNGSNTGTATVTANGGTGAYTYAWSNGSSNSTVNSLLAGKYSVVITDSNGCTHKDSISITQPSALAASITSNNVLCYGNNTGSAKATVSGGKFPYTYLWSSVGATSDSIASLTAGTYSVTITDSNGCTATSSVIISQPASALSLSMSSLNQTCIGSSNGKATVAVSGGTGSYIYSWTNGSSADTISSLSAGTYTVSVKDANGCKDSNSVVITGNSLPIVTISGNVIGGSSICAGKTDTLTANAIGNGPFSYSWNTSSSNDTTLVKAASTYSVTVKDANGCSNTSSINITVNKLPSITITSVPANDSVCAGGTVTLTANGASSYSWSGGITNGLAFTPTISGKYVVTGTDTNGCTNTDTVNVGVNPLPTVVINGKDTIVMGTNDTLSANGAATYAWSTGGTNDSIIVSPTSNTTYTVTCISAKGCSDTVSFTVIVKIPTALNNTGADENTTVYPNPAVEQVFLKFGYKDGSSTSATISILDAAGKEIVKNHVTVFGGETVQLNVADLAAGVYLIRVETNKSIRTTKFIKE